MYFWNLAKLKDELRRGPLTSRAALCYLIAIVVLYDLGFAMERLSTPPPPMTTINWISALIGGVGYLVGMVFAYRANGGAGGADFMGRYLSLAWVIGIRLSAVVIPVCLVGAVGLTLAVRLPETRHQYIGIFGLLVVTGIALFYALALVASIRDVARTEARE